MPFSGTFLTAGTLSTLSEGNQEKLWKFKAGNGVAGDFGVSLVVEQGAGFLLIVTTPGGTNALSEICSDSSDEYDPESEACAYDPGTHSDLAFSLLGGEPFSIHLANLIHNRSFDYTLVVGPVE